MAVWAILTGEYPPTIGGVSDYTRAVAVALAAAGDRVEVYAPPATTPLTRDEGVTVHALPDALGPRSLAWMTWKLRDTPDAQLLVQYVPQRMGLRGMNLPLVAWIAARPKPVWMMFHEVAYPYLSEDTLRRRAFALVTRAMAAGTAMRAGRIFVSTPRWGEMIRSYWSRAPEATWLPIPSNAPTRVSDADAARMREKLGLQRGSVHIGHFGTYGALIARELDQILVPLLTAKDDRVAVLLGRGGPEFAQTLRGKIPESRVIAPGVMSMEDVAACLASCVLVVQPYEDGVSARRTTAMAPLALGVPVVTNAGARTEPDWAESKGVAVARDVPSMIPYAEELLASPKLRTEMGARGRELYARSFSIERTVRTLRSAEGSA